MGKIAFVFSGQGAQYVGMGKELTEVSAAAKDVFTTAESLRPGIISRCFDGPKEELNRSLVFIVRTWLLLWLCGKRELCRIWWRDSRWESWPL